MDFNLQLHLTKNLNYATIKIYHDFAGTVYLRCQCANKKAPVTAATTANAANTCGSTSSTPGRSIAFTGAAACTASSRYTSSTTTGAAKKN